MSKTAKKAVLFDLDGTLWDSSRAFLPAWNEVLAAHSDVRGPVTLEEIGSYMGLTPEVMAGRMFPTLASDEALRLLYLCFDAEEKILREKGAILYEGVEALLSALHNDYFVAIVSNSQDGYVQAFLDYYGFWQYVDDIEMAGRTGKPKWDNITLVLERAGIDRRDALYIGDTQGDLDAADKAGVRFIFADYGFGKVDRTTPSAKAPSALLPIIRAMLQ